MSNQSTPSSDWVRCQSKSRADRFYMFNKKTGETKWCRDMAQTTPQKTVPGNVPYALSSSVSKTPAQDRLKRLQKNLEKKKIAETMIGKGKDGRQTKIMGKEPDVVKTNSVAKPGVSTSVAKPNVSQKALSNLQKIKSPISVQKKLERTPKNKQFQPTAGEVLTNHTTKKTAKDHKFLIPKKPDSRSAESSCNLETKKSQNKSETEKKSSASATQPILSNIPLNPDQTPVGSSEDQSTKFPDSTKCVSSTGKARKERSLAFQLRKLPYSPDQRKASSKINCSSEKAPTSKIANSSRNSMDRPLDTVQNDINANERVIKEEPKAGIMSTIKGFYNKLITKAMNPKKRKQPAKQANLSHNSKPAFKPKKPDNNNVLRGILQENENGSIQKDLPSITQKLVTTSHKVSSPIPVPKEGVNARLQRLRTSLHLQQALQNSTPNISGTSASNFFSESSSIRSSSTSASECEPMDWQPILEDISEPTISPSSPQIAGSADSSGLSEHYNTVNENLMRLSATKRQTKQWKTDHFYFVVDTNVFLENLLFVEELTTMKLSDTMGTVIYVPYCVLQELDKLKIRSPSESVKLRSNRAIKYLNRSFEEKYQLVQAQSAADEAQYLIKITSPDDSILNCCLQVKEHVENILLLTEDINLHNKAICNDILVSTRSDLISKHESFI